jgi:hypothetical protein
MEDLSFIHRPITSMIRIPSSPDEWRQYALTGEQLDFYRREGYVTGIQLLTEEQVDILCEELTPLFDPDHSRHGLFHEFHSNESKDAKTVLFHALGAWRVARAFHDILWNPAFTVPASQLLGGSVRFWHDQLFCKPPLHGGVVAWHQDYSYWTRTIPMAHLTCFIALDDTDLANGCLHHVPGTHRWPLLPITGLTGDMDDIRTVLDSDQKAEFRPVPTRLKRGYASFHHPLTVHGSFGNTSPRPRRATVINVFRDGVASASDKPLLQGLPIIPDGQTLSGQFFPLLFDPKQAGFDN